MSFAAALSHPLQSFFPRKAAEPRAETAPKSLCVDNLAYTHALVALAAKLAACDGTPGAAECASFQQLFVGEENREAAKLKSIFVRQVEDQSSALQYARQIMNATYGQPALHRDLLGRLLMLANADAMPNAAELELLRAIATTFRISGEEFKALVARTLVPTGSPYELLGVSPTASDESLRLHYMVRVQKLHPDRYQAAGASAETIAVLSDQLAALNAAYETVRAARCKKNPRGRSAAPRRNTKGVTADA